MSDFKRISIKDRDLICSYLSEGDNIGCEFSFGNNILWDISGQLMFCVVDDILVYRLDNKSVFYYYTPSFKGNSEAFVSFIQNDAASMDKKYVIGSLNESMKNELSKAFGGKFEYNFDRNLSDYVYLVDELAELKGRKFHKKKNHYNSFVKNNDFVYETISRENVRDCLEMKNRWMAQKGELTESLHIENTAIDKALSHYEAFGFEGGLIRINGVVCAFTLGEGIGKDTFVTHFEKADDSVNGLYAAINKEFTTHELLGKYRYVNREEDMGLEGLRQAKMTYNPVMIYEKYSATPIC